MDIARPDRKREIRRRRILWGVLAGLALIAITVGISSLEPAVREVDRASVWIDAVQRGEMLRAVRGPGTLVPEEIRWIAAETEGQVERIVIRPGAQVTTDTVILELSNPEVEQTAEEARLRLLAGEAEYEDLRVRLESELLDQQANLARAKADHESADLQAEADRELHQNGLIPEIQLKQSRLAAEQLAVRYTIEQQRLEKTRESIAAQLAARRTEVDQRRALYDLRRGQLASHQVRAGINGVLQQVPVEEGQRVTPGTNLARVARPERLKAELRIAETQAKDIVIGQIAQIDTRNGVVQGRVVRIDPAVQQGTVTVDVTLEGELPKGARPDLSVDGVVELERLVDILYVGRPAYGQPMSTVGLYKLSPDGNRAERVNVKLGRSSVNTIEILAGLNAGDKVILSDSSQWDDAPIIGLK